jgi:hypothetical protein
MIRLTVTPGSGENLYAMLVTEEIGLRRKGTGTLHRSGAKGKDRDKWVHSSYKGWVRFQRGLGGILVALVQSKSPEDEWMLLSSFVGFLDRHFRASISSINLVYGSDSGDQE